eukprot:TRINITY_DN49848_c0_g1_i1.p1 TRINITY_DN49848_c0_g1~~TRINITY_DN49848_c0_g1_i1.p1  ORF type:complete len:531 (-),score=61.90 TRINITY_DN49848_c0_g1_i1:90-1682(-)
MDDGTVEKEVWAFGSERLSKTVSADIFREMVVLRRRLHEMPELAFNEFRTAAIVREELRGVGGIHVLDAPVGGTGVVALIRGCCDSPVGVRKKVILFRADMDALPIPEANSENSDSNDVKRRKLGAAGTYGCCGLCGKSMLKTVATDVPRPCSSHARKWSKFSMSKEPGASHACGHDGHMAMLIGAAKVIAARREQLQGSVVLCFQPAEERHPINNPMGGAIRMIRDVTAGEELCRALGAQAKPSSKNEENWTAEERNLTDGHDTSMDGSLLDSVDEVYGAHLWNYASAGTIGCAPGSVTANSDSLEIVVSGTGGHASAPQGTVDPVVVAAQLIQALQCIVSRNTSPTESCVITLGKIEGGVAPNVIATTVKILGTVRTYTRPVKRMVQRRLREIADGVAASHGPRCSIEVKYSDGYPACVNDASCAEAVLSAGNKLLGERLVGSPTPNMAGEDFSFLLSRKPGAFFFVGSNPEAKFASDPSVPVEEEEHEHGTRKVIAHHTPEFDIHEGALWCGAAMWVALATSVLQPE